VTVKEVVSFRLSKELFDALNELSRETGIPRSELLRLAVEKFLRDFDGVSEELKRRLEIKSLISENRKRMHELFFMDRYRKTIFKAIKAHLRVWHIREIMDNYRKEAELLGQMSEWMDATREALLLMEKEGYSLAAMYDLCGYLGGGILEWIRWKDVRENNYKESTD
jgi:predicted DNA-binding protein